MGQRRHSGVLERFQVLKVVGLRVMRAVVVWIEELIQIIGPPTSCSETRPGHREYLRRAAIQRRTVITQPLRRVW